LLDQGLGELIQLGLPASAEHEQPVHLGRARLASLAELSGDAILADDLNGNITDWNSGAELLYG
jgi:PAS domain-containing protein